MRYVIFVLLISISVSAGLFDIFSSEKIAFVDTAKKEVFMMNVDGSGLKQITHNKLLERKIDLSFDRKNLVFISGNKNLYLVDVQTGLETPLVTKEVNSARFVDDNKILCVEERKVYTMDIRTKNKKRVKIPFTHEAYNEIILLSEDFYYIEGGPLASRNYKFPDKSSSFYDKKENKDIWMNKKLGRRFRFGTNASRDGKFLVFSSEGQTERKHKGKIRIEFHTPKIKVYNVENHTFTVLHKDREEYETFPCFSPDGTKIIFTTKMNDRTGLFIMNIDGSDVKPVGPKGSSFAVWR